MPSAFVLPHALAAGTSRRMVARSGLSVARCSVSAERESSTSTCFGKGTRLSRRAVGVWELSRAGVDAYRVFADGSRRSDAAIGTVVGVFVAAILGAPLLLPGVPVEGPVAGVAGALLGIWALDALVLESLIGRLLSIAVGDRRRRAVHEAGHFLVAYLVGLKVRGYVMPSVKAVIDGVECGVDVELGSDVYNVAAAGMAGVAAECLEFGSSEGGNMDLKEVREAVRSAGMTSGDEKRIARWGLLQAALLLQSQKSAFMALKDAMSNGLAVEECTAIIEGNFDWKSMTEKES